MKQGPREAGRGAAATRGVSSGDGEAEAAAAGRGASIVDGGGGREGVAAAGWAAGRIASKEYYSIGEVCEITGLKPHVLRYWESQFRLLNPSKNRAGNRAYRRKDIQLIQLVKHLLYTEKFTIEGAKQKLDDLRRGRETGIELPSPEAERADLLQSIKQELEELNRRIEAFRERR